jgi:hypothetical protein
MTDDRSTFLGNEKILRKERDATGTSFFSDL